MTASRPKYVYNIKMACVKDEWTLYSSSEIQINVNYKVSSKIRLHIGNKTNKVLGGFEVAQNGAVVHIS